jgi:hypothetical protein
MRRVRTSAAALALAIAGLVVASSADAQSPQLPTCTSSDGRYANLQLHAPAKVAFERSFAYSMNDTAGPKYFLGDGWATFLGPNGASLTHGYVDAPIHGDAPRATLARGEATGVLSVKVSDTDFRPTGPVDCQRIFTALVAGFDGKQPSISRGVKYANEYYETDRAQLSLVHPTDCAQAAVGEITVTVRLGGQTVRLRLNDQCRHTWERTGPKNPRGWQAETDGRSVYIGLTRSRMERRTFVYSIAAADGSSLQRGHIRAQTDYQGGHTVYEGTDAFVNYCIDRAKDIRSQGGRLYCWYEGYTKRYYDFTK